MASVPRTYTREQQGHLALKVEPSGLTIEELAERSAYYGTTSVPSTLELAKDPKRRRELHAAWASAPGATRIGAPGASIHVFGYGGTFQLDKLQAELAWYDAELAKEPQTFEDHFLRANYASSALMYFQEYMINQPLRNNQPALTTFQMCRIQKVHEKMEAFSSILTGDLFEQY